MAVAFSCASILNLYFCFCVGGSAVLDSDKPGSSVVEIQCLLDSVGATELVIDLIVNTKNDQVFEESILLGIALLQGGNTQIQVGSADFPILIVPNFGDLCSPPRCLPTRTPSTTSCTSRPTLRSSSKFSTIECAWPSRRSEPPCPLTCLKSAAGKVMTAMSLAGG